MKRDDGDAPKAREVIAAALDDARGDPLCPRVLMREADAVLTALADAGFAVVVRRRIESGGGWTDWPGPAARA